VFDISPEIQEFAHFLVDECNVKIIHGHSAHHVQGVELRNGALIMYGCGDALGKTTS
jgi:poly-gamma-glutamate capsule biosynthesis protein CapA/YwtB (metallophosphatase superfamily)